MIIHIGSLVGGLILLFFGGEGLVRGAASLALRFGISRLLIGLTVVAFGTSAPELVVSINATLEENGAIAVGNVIGSNICNIGLILGLSALISPMRVSSQVLLREAPILLGVSFLSIFFLFDGEIARWEGVLLALGILLYCVTGYLMDRKATAEGAPVAGSAKDEGSPEEEDALEVPTEPSKNIWLDLGLIAAGLLFLISGADLFVDGAVALARTWGISEAVIGLTLVALGTSLPELATSVVAATKGESEIAVGNVIGSNVFNLLAVLGIAAMVDPIRAGEISRMDLTTMIVMALLLTLLMWLGRSISRWKGAVLLLVYTAYIAWLGFQSLA